MKKNNENSSKNTVKYDVLDNDKMHAFQTKNAAAIFQMKHATGFPRLENLRKLS